MQLGSRFSAKNSYSTAAVFNASSAIRKPFACAFPNTPSVQLCSEAAVQASGAPSPHTSPMLGSGVACGPILGRQGEFLADGVFICEVPRNSNPFFGFPSDGFSIAGSGPRSQLDNPNLKALAARTLPESLENGSSKLPPSTLNPKP